MQQENQVDNKSDLTQNSETDGRGKHPNSQANLKPYPKGVTGNAGGRPTKYAKMKEALDDIGYNKPQSIDLWSLDTDSDFMNNKEKVLNKIWFEAGRGSIKHIQFLADLGCLDDVNPF